jgi:hypothetical protein
MADSPDTLDSSGTVDSSDRHGGQPDEITAAETPQPTPLIRQLLIQPSDNQEVTVEWHMPDEGQAGSLAQGRKNAPHDATGLQLKIHDVTAIDLDHQPPHHTRSYDVPAAAFDGNTAHMTVPVPQGDRDYLAEVGYVTPDHQWMALGRSLHTYVPASSPSPVDDNQFSPEQPGAEAMPEATPEATVTGDPSTFPSIPSSGQVPEEAQPPEESRSLTPDSSEHGDASDHPPAVASAAAAGLGIAGLGAMAIAHSKDEQSDESHAAPSISPSTVTLSLAEADDKDLRVQWSVSDQQLDALSALGNLPLNMRIYDVTGIDLNYQPAHQMERHTLNENSTELVLTVPHYNRDYLAELGYETTDGEWHQLGRSLHVYVPEPEPAQSPDLPHPPKEEEPSESAAAAAIMPPGDAKPAPAPLPLFNPATRQQLLTVNSQNHSYLLNEEQMAALQSTAQTTTLDPGSYLITIEDSSVKDDPESSALFGEPMVMLWLYGGRFINKQTNVETTATWASLNGLGDVLNVDVIEPMTLSALFFDVPHADQPGHSDQTDNQLSQTTLLILKDD